MKYQFVCKEHEDYGTNGWRLESQPGFDPLGGMAVAHDIIEHFPDGDESPADEFQALGASLFIRDASFYRNYNPATNIASEFPMIIGHVIHQGMPLKAPPRTQRLGCPEAERDIQETMNEGLCLMESEFHDEDRALARNAAKKAMGWLRIGYRRAEKRFGGNLTNVRRAFRKIQEEADKLLEHAQVDDKLIIDVNLKTGTVRCYIEEPAYNEDEEYSYSSGWQKTA
jgi:hypothetical protein